MKKILNLAVCVMGLFALVGCGSKESAVLKMATEATFPPYEFLQGSEIVGIDVEIVRAIAAKLNKGFVCENMMFDSVIPAVISKKADIAAAGIL